MNQLNFRHILKIELSKAFLTKVERVLRFKNVTKQRPGSFHGLSKTGDDLAGNNGNWQEDVHNGENRNPGTTGQDGDYKSARQRVSIGIRN